MSNLMISNLIIIQHPVEALIQQRPLAETQGRYTCEIPQGGGQRSGDEGKPSHLTGSQSWRLSHLRSDLTTTVSQTLRNFLLFFFFVTFFPFVGFERCKK